MIPEIGHFSLILAFCFAIMQGIIPLVGVLKKNETLMHFAVPTARAQSFLVALSFLCLDYAFYTNDFSVVLNRRLMMLSPKNEGKASSMMSLCIGALILSRLESDLEKSNEILNQAYRSALSLIEKRDLNVAELT